MRVCITGASGFLGGHLVHWLAQKNWHVSALSRSVNVSPTGLAAHPLIEPIAVDYSQSERLGAILRGHDVVIHLAGVAHAKDPGAQNYQEGVIDLTQRVWSAAAKARVPKFVFASSIKVYGEDKRHCVLTEQTPPTPETPYGLAKWLAEQYLVNQSKGGDAPALYIFRIPPIYGKQAKGLIRHLFRYAKWGIPLPLANLANKRAFISIHNLLVFFASACEGTLTPGLYIPEESPARAVGAFYQDVLASFDHSFAKRWRWDLPAWCLKLAQSQKSLSALFSEYDLRSNHRSLYAHLALKSQWEAIQAVAREMTA